MMGEDPVLRYFVTVRSPFSYLSVPRVVQLATTPGIAFEICPVYPLALRRPEFFEAGPPMLLNYLRRDAERVAEMLGMPFAWPDPDPVAQNLETSEISAHQPHVHRLTRLLAAACELGHGLEYYREMSHLLFSGSAKWTDGQALAAAAERAGVSLQALEEAEVERMDELDTALHRNAKRLEAAGHWGTPTLTFADETFFGQDRIAMCSWHMRKLGFDAPDF